MKRAVVLMSGAPASGKTSLAEPLAAALDFPLVSEDFIKESLFDSLNGATADQSWSPRLGTVAREVVWTVAERCPYVVFDVSIRPRSEYDRARLTSLTTLGGSLIEVHCVCPPEICAERFATRQRHLAHAQTELTAEMFADLDGPVGLGPVLAVDCTRAVDIVGVATKVRALIDHDFADGSTSAT